MKIPPGHREASPVRVVAAVEGERDRRFLIFGGVVLVAIALGFKSDIWAENQVWVLSHHRWCSTCSCGSSPA
ncbi:MAG: hypothetical protein E6I77_07390 [Chloroflexi bacterium]|nr:MAG: hypothetical protein E6I77_07390 [Chloroflexota bacterium]